MSHSATEPDGRAEPAGGKGTMRVIGCGREDSRFDAAESVERRLRRHMTIRVEAERLGLEERETEKGKK